MICRSVSFIFFSLLSINILFAQSDTLSLKADAPKHSPTAATLMSMAVPGLGQAYNKKYWKIPIVYAVIGTSLYFALDQQSKFKDFRKALGNRLDDDSSTVDLKYNGKFTNDNLRSLIDFHRKNRDILYVLTAISYALNILDAAVDAHLYHFDVSDNLSGIVKPDFQFLAQEKRIVPSLQLSLKFGKTNRINYY